MRPSKFVRGVGFVDAYCPVDIYPDKSVPWRSGFVYGWEFAKRSQISTPIPKHSAEIYAGFVFGMSQFTLLHGKAVTP